jgi:hypothetical protein
MLLSGSGDELCELLPSLLYAAVAYHHLLSALLPFQPLFTENSCENQLLALPPSPVRFQQPPLCCVLVFGVSFFWGGSVFLRGYAGLSQGWLRNIM